MKNSIKRILTIVTISSLISVTVIASGYSQTIEVTMNSIKVRVNGEYMSGDNILYKGTTYVPLRAVGEVLGKDIDWDGKTKTANIKDRSISRVESNFKVPSGIPKGATLVEASSEYKYHKFNYIVDLPSGGRITQVSISKAPGQVPYIWLVGHDNKKLSFIRGRSTEEPLLDSISYYSKHWAENFTKADEDLAYEEIGKFFKAYGYEDLGHDEWLKFTR